MTNISVTKPYQKRRRYSKELKARIVAECLVSANKSAPVAGN